MVQSMHSDPMPLFHELTAVHRGIFAEEFGRLRWSMVASFECSIKRIGSTIAIEKTSFWLCPDRTSGSGLTMVFVNPKDKMLGQKLSSEAITRATNQTGDISFILGFANSEYTANQAFEAHLRDDSFEPNGSYSHALSPRTVTRGQERSRRKRSGRKSAK